MDSKSEIILYQPDNEVRLEVRAAGSASRRRNRVAHTSANGRVVPNDFPKHNNSHQEHLF